MSDQLAFVDLAVPGVRGLRPYEPGKPEAELAREHGLELADIVKLASNENPLGPSPLAVAALQAAVSEAHRYPGVAERELRRKLAARHGLTPDHYVIASGGTDVLRVIAQAFIFDDGAAVMPAMTFPMYTLLTGLYGGRVQTVPAGAGGAIDLAGIAAAVAGDTRIVWLCSPNNPTGLTLAHEAVATLLAGLPEHVVLVLDESYRDYVDDPEAVDGLALLAGGRPVVLVRSFSKSAGLANLRVGYAVAPPPLAAYLRRGLLPFNTGAPVIRAALASLDDTDYQRRSRELVLAERRFLYDGLCALGLRALPSQANFVLALDPPGGAAALVAALERDGIIVRLAGGFGAPNGVRITVGLRAQNVRVLAAIERLTVAARD